MIAFFQLWEGKTKSRKDPQEQLPGLALGKPRDLVESNLLAASRWRARAPGNCGLDQRHHCQPDVERRRHNTATFKKSFRQHDFLPGLRRTADRLFSRNVRAIQER